MEECQRRQLQLIQKICPNLVVPTSAIPDFLVRSPRPSFDLQEKEEDFAVPDSLPATQKRQQSVSNFFFQSEQGGISDHQFLDRDDASNEFDNEKSERNKRRHRDQ